MTVLDQTSQTEGNATSLKITGLTNGTQYFFAVKAVDSKGLESAEPSVTIAVTPIGPETEIPTETEPTETEGLFPAATETPTGTLYNNPLTGSPSSNTIALSWQPFPGIAATYYKVYFGLNAGQYDDYVVTPDNRTTFAVNDLINGVSYYFAVVAVNLSGNEISPLSAELRMAPQGGRFMSLPADQVVPGRPGYASILSNTKFSQVPTQEETGPETTWMVIGAITLAGGLFYLNKRRLFR